MAETLRKCPPDEELAGDPGLEEYLDEFRNAQTYEPFPKQRDFHELTAPRKGLICGLGFGKTTVSTMEGLFHAWDYNGCVQHVGIVGAPTYPMIRDVILPSYRQLWPGEILRGGSWETGFVKSEMTLYLENGSAVLFRSLEAGRFEKLRGVEFVGWASLGEASLMPDDAAWRVMLGRLRYRRVPVRSAWLDTTPRGEDWVADRFILNPQAGYACIRGTSMDNPALAASYVEEMASEYDERFYAQEILGEIVGMQGAVYPHLSRLPWPHGNVVRFQPKKDSVTYLGVDFGRLHPRGVFFQTYQAYNEVTGKYVDLDVIVDEVTTSKGKPPHDLLVGEFAELARERGWNVRAVYGDPAGDSRNEHTYQSAAKQLCAVMGGVPFYTPKGKARIKVTGEQLMAARIRDHQGGRRLAWAASGLEHPQGGLYTVAENSWRATAALRYAEEKVGQAQAQESHKDGKNDHDTDLIRYYLTTRARTLPRWAPAGGMID